MKLKKKKVGIYMATITIERDGLNLVGTREEPFGEIYDMAIIFHGFTANRNTLLLKEIADELRCAGGDGFSYPPQACHA